MKHPFDIPLYSSNDCKKNPQKKARIPKINISHFKASKMSSLSMSIQDFHLLVDPQDSDFETKVQYKLFSSACVYQNMLYFAVIVFSYLFCVKVSKFTFFLLFILKFYFKSFHPAKMKYFSRDKLNESEEVMIERDDLINLVYQVRFS